MRCISKVSKSLCCNKNKNKNLQKRSTKYIFVFIVVIVVVTRLVPAALGAGGSLDGGGPLHGAGQGRRRSDVLHVVKEAELVEAPRRVFVGLRKFVGSALGLRAVRVAQHPHGGHRVPLDPRVVVADNVLMVEARQQRHLAFDPPELLTGWIDLDALHSIVTAVQFILNLNAREETDKSFDNQSRVTAQ